MVELARIAQDLEGRRAILFVGAGVSAQLGLPSWRGLIERLGRDLGFDTQAVRPPPETDFRPLMEYYRIKKGSVRALRDWIDDEWAVSDEALKASVIHDIIVSLDFPLIYTTNYDDLLERAFRLRGRGFNKVVTAKDLAAADDMLPTIVKFHGDLGDPASLVISETDYFRRLAFDTPLDIKLAADALGRAVLFIGYSLSDINVRLMLFRMRSVWQDSGYEDSQPRSYVFMPRPDPVQETILGSWGITAIAGDHPDESLALQRFMERLYEAVVPRDAAGPPGKPN